jgi:ribosome-binding ATPase YchF (GTP1/OBG family)
MSLTVGIVGLPNAGKSTLFNALASRRLAETAPRPFTTIEPHEAVVAIPDKWLDRLWDLIRGDPSTSLRMTGPERVPATVTFIDIAGLVRGAHKGEGLGNRFLGKIREVDAIVHVVRAFIDPGITHQHPTYEPGSIKQVLEDIETINIELQLGEIEKKPIIYVLNVDENDLVNIDYLAEVEKKYKEKAVLISAKMEEELIDFSEKEREAYLKEVGVDKTGLERLIIQAYSLLDLISFYTIKGGKEIHAWSLKRGSIALDAAERVHTDFARKFIKAEIINVEQLLELGSWKQAGEGGKIRLEGKDYVVCDRDVIEFKVGG